MGGLGYTISIEPVGDAGARSDVSTFRKAFWEHAINTMYQHLRRPGSSDVLEYASQEFYDRRDDSDESGLGFTFMDCAGCCSRSMYAMMHFVDFVFALERPTFDRIAAKHGYRITREHSSVATLVREGVRDPLMNVGGTLWKNHRRRLGEKLTESLMGDSAHLDIEALDEKDRVIAERISLTGRCHCELCSHARKTVKPKKPRGQKKDDPFDDKTLDVNVPKAETLLTTDPEAIRLMNAAVAPVRAWGDAEWAATPAGPAEFQVLRDYLESKDALIATIALTGILHRC